MITTIRYLVLLLILTSCLQELPVQIDRVDSQLVVEASINTQVETYEVKLASVSNFDGITTNSSFRDNAIVEIIEIDGPTYRLTEIGAGIYWTLPGQVVGEVGKSYQLRIELSNGEVYESSIETIPEPVNILSGEAVYFEREVLNENDVASINLGHDAVLELENPNEDHFYIVENKSWVAVDIGYDDCCLTCEPAGPATCWNFRDPITSNQAIIGSNVGLSDQNYLFNAFPIPFDFKKEYIAFITLHSMSVSNYLFWNSVNEQLDRPGGLFDRPFAPIVGNISQVNGSNVALGYFHAYGSNEFILCFDRADVEGSVFVPFPIPCPVLCTEVWSPGTFDDVSDVFCN